MEIEVNVKDMLEALTVVSSIVNPKVSELVKRQIRIQANGENIGLTTFNDSTVLDGTVNGVVKEDGSACIDMFYLLALLNKLGGEAKIKTDDKIARINCGRSKYKTTTYPMEEFKEYLKYGAKFPLENTNVELSPLQNALECIYSSSAKDDDNLSGAYIYHNQNGDMITCSNSELGATVNKEGLIAFPEGVLPRFLIDFILKLKSIRFLELAGNDEGYFHGRAGPYSFLYRAPSFEYPWEAIHEIIKGSQAYDSSFRFNNSDMLGALGRIGVITDETSHRVEMKIDEGLLTLSVEGPGHSGQEVVDLSEPVGYEYVISLDSLYLSNILKDFEGIVEWSFFDEDNAQFVTDGYLTKFFMGLSE